MSRAMEAQWSPLGVDSRGIHTRGRPRQCLGLLVVVGAEFEPATFGL